MSTTCLQPLPQLLPTSSHILVHSSTIAAPSTSDYVTPSLSASMTPFLSASVTPPPPLQMQTSGVSFQFPPVPVSDFHPFPSLQPSSSPIAETEISLTEWLYISIALLLFVLVIIITTLLSVIILLIRRNSVRSVVTAGKKTQ